MTDLIDSARTPEELELDKKKAELESLETELADRELELATLNAELSAFEKKYLRIVGTRYAQLDELEAKITEALAEQYPHSETAQDRAREARAKADESAGEAEAAPDDSEEERPAPSESLKKLYREAAKAAHPDLAANDEDRAARERVMAEINEAYAKGDEARLRQILQEWKSRPEAVEGEGAGAELVRTIRMIARVRDRLKAIDAEIDELRGSELNTLKEKVEAAENEGRDLLWEMASDLDEQIADAEEKLAVVRG